MSKPMGLPRKAPAVVNDPLGDALAGMAGDVAKLAGTREGLDDEAWEEARSEDEPEDETDETAVLAEIQILRTEMRMAAAQARAYEARQEARQEKVEKALTFLVGKVQARAQAQAATTPPPPAQQSQDCSYAKLGDDEWGIRTPVGHNEGDQVLVVTKGGKKKYERLGSFVETRGSGSDKSEIWNRG